MTFAPRAAAPPRPDAAWCGDSLPNAHVQESSTFLFFSKKEIDLDLAAILPLKHGKRRFRGGAPFPWLLSFSPSFRDVSRTPLPMAPSQCLQELLVTNFRSFVKWEKQKFGEKSFSGFKTSTSGSHLLLPGAEASASFHPNLPGTVRHVPL